MKKTICFSGILLILILSWLYFENKIILSFENIIMYISLFFIFTKIIIPLTDYIISSIFFVKPMLKKYDIMASDISRDIKGRYIIILFCCIIIILFLKLIFIDIINKIFSFIILLTYIISCIILYTTYKKYNILEFIDYFSADLFDWDKIYSSLYITEEEKRACFKIHYIDYDEYEATYISHQENKIRLAKSEIYKINNQKK